MTDNTRKILEEISSNEDWKEELKERLSGVEDAAKNSMILAFVKEKGYEIAEEDFNTDGQELSLEELEQVSGGDGCGCAVCGEGGGCMNCLCVLGGAGYLDTDLEGRITSQGGCICAVGGAGASNRH